jgi:hypothetical protein
MTNRNEILLMSRNRGADFEVAYSHGWNVAACPMSSAFLSETKAGVLAAAETHGRVFFVRVDPKTGKVSEPVSPSTKAKHPVAVGNAKGEVLLVWTEGTGWAKGGAVVWQLYDKDGNALEEKGRADGVPVWSLATAFARPNGSLSLYCIWMVAPPITGQRQVCILQRVKLPRKLSIVPEAEFVVPGGPEIAQGRWFTLTLESRRSANPDMLCVESLP